MAYAAYSESFNALGTGLQSVRVAPAHAVPSLKQLMVLDVTVPSTDAFKVRRLLAGFVYTGVLRCIPKLRDRKLLDRLGCRRRERFDDTTHRAMVGKPRSAQDADERQGQHDANQNQTLLAIQLAPEGSGVPCREQQPDQPSRERVSRG